MLKPTAEQASMEKLFPDAEDGSGFQFGYVHGWIDCHLTPRDGEPAIELIWEGNGEMDSTRTGLGHA